jgi:hypothetical protein
MDSGKTSPNPTVVSDCAKERSEREHDVYIRRRKRDKEREVDSVRYEKKNEEYSTLALKNGFLVKTYHEKEIKRSFRGPCRFSQ